MPHQHCKTVYYFDELSESAKARARDWWRDGLDTDWADAVIEDAVRMAEILGISIATHPVRLMGGGTRHDPTVYWALHVQGAGACFEGTYAYKAGSVKAIQTEAPEDTTLHQIARDLQAVQKQYGYALEARISHTGNSVHSHSVTIEVDKVRGPNECVAEDLIQPLRDFMDWIYDQLNKEFDYQTSDAVVDENIRANEYEFTEDGRRAI